MTPIRTRNLSTLARKMAEPGGRTFEDALARAEARLDSHREAAMAAIGRRLTDLERLCDEQPSGGGAQVYEAAAALLDTAGFFETGPLYAAAFSLCEAADLMNSTNTWRWSAIVVHVDAMRRIIQDGCQSGEAADRLISGLALIVDHVGRSAH